MSLNKQGPGKIDWTDYSLNPISGCRHGCPYCYMRRMEKRFPGVMEPAFHPERLRHLKKIKEPSKIFVGSSGDMWGDWVDSLWLEECFTAFDENFKHTYQFLTKNPSGYRDIPFHLTDAWYGTTDDGTDRCKHNIETLRQCKHDGVFGLDGGVIFVSFEPLIIPIVPVDLTDVNWIIIGADSNKGAEKPPKEWADRLINHARHFGAAVWVKDNYGYPDIIKEFPI